VFRVCERRARPADPGVGRRRYSAAVPSILLVEDDAAQRRTIELGLAARGFDVVAVGDGASARDAVDAGRHDVVVLDLGLPDIDGIELVRRLRVWPGSPIVVVSGADRDHEIVAALAVGADDYMVKPVTIDVLAARIGVQLRHAAHAAPLLNSQVLAVGDVRLDTASHEVEAGGAPISLNVQQFTILAVLMRNPGAVVPHDVLARAMGGPSGGPDRNALRVAVSRLRQRLGTSPRRPTIRTEKQVGYRLVPAASGPG
jgi:two-component system KDP operon response regulator KdpE